jgi:ribonuclease R
VSSGIIRVTRKGLGFVETPEGEYFIPRSRMRGAMDGDRVEVERLSARDSHRGHKRRGGNAPAKGGRRGGDAGGADGAGGAWGTSGAVELLGRVSRVLERAHETLVGTLHYLDGLGVVRPHDVRIAHDIFLDPHIPTGHSAAEGAIVVVRITTYPGRLEAASGYIEEIIGQGDEVGMDLEVIARAHGFETVFSAAALTEAENVAQDDALLKRRDLRDRFIFTIDPADAKDFDDALSLDFIDGQAVLGVHIADVSAYVAWDSALDLNARRRATSVYLPGRVIPMLPPALSDELCSLRPHEDKCAFTVEMTLSAEATVESCAFYLSLIRSSARLTYDEAQHILSTPLSSTQQPPPPAQQPTPPARHSGLVPESNGSLADNNGGSTNPSCPPDPLPTKLHALNRIAQRLTQRRVARGAIEFESVEAKLTLNEQGAPTDVRLRGKTDATSLVEEAMILANEQVAAFMLSHGAPMVYRVHDEPYAAALEELLPTLREFGYALGGAPQTSREIQAILEATAHKPEHHLISTLLLRAMKRARYAPVYTTHFGLASTAYTHFTSPIRRYPDLLVHRLLKYQLAGVEPPQTMTRQLGGLCEHSSEQEREAEQATREATALKLCEYLAKRLNERFTGVITAVNPAGFVVREDTTTAEGFVERVSLSAALIYDPARHRYHDPDTGKGYRLGQPLTVVLRESDPARRRLIFTIA